jgi:hypothetical protein
VFATIAGLALAILHFMEHNLVTTILSFQFNFVVLFWSVPAAATDGKHGTVSDNLKKNLIKDV